MIYPKINTIYKRDSKGNILDGEYSLPEFEYLAENDWIFTEKFDGMNIRVNYIPSVFDKQVKFTGRTDAAQLPTQLLSRLQELFTVGKFENNFNGPITLYGEGYGPGIQNGGKYADAQDFILFDCRVGDWWLKREDVEDVARVLGVDCVPIIGVGTLFYMSRLAACGFTSTFGDFEAEGLVARPKFELFARNGKRIITKIKCRDFK